MSARSHIIRWGIIGTGAIAKKFATALNALGDAKLAAIGSRSQEAADEFAAKFKIPHAHGSYEALVNDPEVDAVYVATPHSCHKDNALSALQAGKAVLVEKPFTINAAETECLIDFAQSRNLLLMEGMWTRYLPLYVKLREMLANGAIGDVRLLTGDFGFKVGPQANPRRHLPGFVFLDGFFRTIPNHWRSDTRPNGCRRAKRDYFAASAGPIGSAFLLLSGKRLDGSYPYGHHWPIANPRARMEIYSDDPFTQ